MEKLARINRMLKTVQNLFIVLKNTSTSKKILEEKLNVRGYLYHAYDKWILATNS